MKRGLGNSDCKFFCRLKNKVKNRLKAIGMALLTGNIGAAIGMVVSAAAEAALGFKKMPGTIDGYDPTPAEEQVLEKWNDNNFIPLCETIESLIISNNANKNTALKLMQFYEAVLYMQFKNKTTVIGLSENAVLYRYGYVKNVFDDIRTTLTDKPTQLMTVQSSDIASLLKSVQADLTDMPGKLDIQLFSIGKTPVDVDLNLPTKSGGIKSDVELIKDIVNYDKDTTKGTTNPENETPKQEGDSKQNKKITSPAKMLFGALAFTGVILGIRELVKTK